jgi:hypothetical protein
MSKEEDQPYLPYAGTSGWSGSSASRDRAKSDDESGKTSIRQQQALDFLNNQRDYGATWKELSDYLDWHHGQSSGCLSVLHLEGVIVRLTQRRNRCSVYVLPEFVRGREVSERKTKTCKHCGGDL